MPPRSATLVRIIPLLALALGAPALAQSPAAQPRAQVMVLGTPHWANPGLDMSNAHIDDVLTERRQAEIAAILDALAEFRPTRIAIESEPSRDSVWNAAYQRYLRGQFALGRDERHQIGFRLAKTMGHDRVYGVDVKQDMDFGGVMGWAAQNGQGEIAQRIGAAVQAIVAEQNETVRTGTLGRVLLLDNSPRADSLDALYTVFAPIGNDSTFPGAEMAAGWYERNLKIFANISRVARPGDRVLVIMGSGHGPLLRRFVEDHPDYDLVLATPYLERFRAGASR